MSFLHRLKAAWQALWFPHAKAMPESDDEELLSLRRDLAGVRLELQEARDALAGERGRRKAHEEGQATMIKEGLQTYLEDVFCRLAAPLSQLRLQEALLESGVPVPSQDIMTLARQVAEAIKQAGLDPIGAPNTVMRFDPEAAQPLTENASFPPGEKVIVKFIGYRYQGQVLRKALVEKGT